MKKGYLTFSIKYRYLLIGIISILPVVIKAQGIYNNGAKIVLTSTSNIYVDGSTGQYRSESSGIITNNTTGGTLILIGNWLNNGGNTGFSNDGATVAFNGASQSIDGSSQSSFYNISAAGTGTKTFSNASSISNLLTLGSNITVNANANLTLLATSTSNANVASIPSNSSITGNAYVQVYFTGNNTATYRGTRAISSPVTEAVSTTYQQLKNYMVITGANGGGFDPGGSTSPYATSLTKYNEGVTLSQNQFTPITNITNTLSPGNGAFLFYRGSRAGYTTGTASTSNKVNAPFTAPENVTMPFYGPINQQNVVVTVPYTNNGEVNHDGYKLVGNPYPAVIHWSSITKSNMVDEIKIVKPTGGFANYKNGVTTNVSGFSGNILYIMPGQGFYVRSQSGGGSITFTEASKSFAASPMRLMSSPLTSQFLTNTLTDNPIITTSSIHKELRINLQDDKNIEEAVTVFNAGNSSESGQEDAVLFGGSSVTLSTLSSDSVKLTINFMPEIKEVQELRLSVNATVSGPVKLNFADLSAVENYDVLLKDSYLNTTTTVSINTAYDFTIDKTIPTSYGNDRFKLIFKPVSQAQNFIAKKVQKGAELTWSVNIGSVNSKFQIERSEDGVNFNQIGNIDYNSSSSTFTFLDKKPFSGNNYYRLKQYDNNGNEILSKPAFLDYQILDKVYFSVYPNPANEWINIDLNKQYPSLVLTIHDLQGKELKRSVFLKDQPLQENIAALVPGIYVIQLTVESTKEKIGTTKIIKQ